SARAAACECARQTALPGRARRATANRPDRAAPCREYPAATDCPRNRSRPPWVVAVRGTIARNAMTRCSRAAWRQLVVLARLRSATASPQQAEPRRGGHFYAASWEATFPSLGTWALDPCF